eukprot:761700_1
MKGDTIPSEYVFDVNNTFLHSMFEATNAKKIKHIAGHKLVLVFIVVVGLIAFALGRIFGDDSTVFNVYTITFYCLCAFHGWYSNICCLTSLRLHFVFKHLITGSR